MVACTLAFDLDRENAWDFVPNTQMCKETLWPQTLSREEVDPTAQESVAFLTAESYDLLVFGSAYLRCVRRDNVNIGLLNLLPVKFFVVGKCVLT